MSTDDRIRQALERALPESPVDAERLAAELTERYTHHDEWPDASSDPSGGSGGTGAGLGFPLLGLIGVVVGGLAGILIALLIGSPSPVSSATLGLDGVPVFACPGEGRAGTLHRGDRIYIVGQADGWLAVRNVRGSGETVFVEARYVTPDEDVSDLPRRDCEPEGILTIGDLEETTTTTEPTEETTTTTAPEQTTTTTPPTTTTVPDTTAPVIGNVLASPDVIYEDPTPGCPQIHTAEIEAFVTDDRQMASVQARWQFPGQPVTTIDLTGGPNYSGVFGPFAPGTVPVAHPVYDVDVVIMIVARDGAGNQATEALPPVKVYASTWQCIG